jgi:hypothetical protein
MSAPQPLPSSDDLDRLRNLVNTRPWGGLRPVPVAVLIGGISAVELAGVRVWWGFIVLAGSLALGGGLWLREYYRSRFGITGAMPLPPLPSPPLLALAAVSLLIPPVVAARHYPNDWRALPIAPTSRSCSSYSPGGAAASAGGTG